MGDVISWAAPITSALLLLLIVELVRRRLLREEYSFVWLLGGAVLLGLSLWRESLHAVAQWLGIHYPPAVLLLAVVLFGFVGALGFSVIVSRHRGQIERLVQDVALLSAKQRELEQQQRERDAKAGGEGLAQSGPGRRQAGGAP